MFKLTAREIPKDCTQPGFVGPFPLFYLGKMEAGRLRVLRKLQFAVGAEYRSLEFQSFAVVDQ